MQNVINYLTVVLSGLIAGLFFSYSCSVNLGLRTLSDSEYVRAMQAINIAIQNPIFLLAFMGLLFLFPIATYFKFRQEADSSFYYMLFASILYLVGVLGITFTVNVPLNEKLAGFNSMLAHKSDFHSARQLFESPWNYFHSIRTLAAIAAFGLSVISILKQNKAI